MPEPSNHLSRADILRRIAGAPAVALFIGSMAESAQAAATVSQQAASYQKTPKNGQQCSTCQLYIPATSNPATANGTCKVVQGAISPKGWCKFYNAKPK